MITHWWIPLVAILSWTVSHSQAQDSRCDLVDVMRWVPALEVEMRYAKDDNFLNKAVYPASRCLLHREAAIALSQVQAQLLLKGYRLKIWDAYRPLSVQKQMWKLKPDPRYVANPVQGSRHNRGAAVDCTLVNFDGVELEMPSKFDDFSPAAHASALAASEVAKINLGVLQNAMREGRFSVMNTEWWHFDYAEWKGYPALDVPITVEEASSTSDESGNGLNIPTNTRQLVTVVSESWGAITAIIRRYERKGNDSQWTEVGESAPVVIGKAGMAWGKGLHNKMQTGPGEKKEGDRRSPSGSFFLTAAFGQESASADLKFPYQRMTPNHIAVDDSTSVFYNRIVNSKSVQKDWKTAEDMIHQPPLYRLGLVVQHNWAQAAGAGSCIFLHIWRQPDKATVGCTAMSPETIKKMMEWLDITCFPVLVQLPKDEYKQLTERNMLPSIVD